MFDGLTPSLFRNRWSGGRPDRIFDGLGGGGSDFRWTGGGSIQVFDGRQVSPHPKSMYRLLSGGGFRWTMVEAGGSFN